MAEIESGLLLELLGLELKSSEQRKPQSGEDFEKVGYSIDFRRELWFTPKSLKVRDMCRHLEWVRF